MKKNFINVGDVILSEDNCVMFVVMLYIMYNELMDV